MFELLQPWCSRRVSRKTLDKMLAYTEPFYQEMRYEAPLVQLKRDLRQGDQIWLTIEPPPHPEFSKGSIFFYLLRKKQIVRRYHVMTA